MIFIEYLDKFFVVFIDDILIYLYSKVEHVRHLKIFLEMLRQERLYTKFHKCEFWLKRSGISRTCNLRCKCGRKSSEK